MNIIGCCVTVMTSFSQDLVFPGFEHREECVIPLPGKLEALPILDLVTKANSVPVSTDMFICINYATIVRCGLLV